MSLYVNSPAQAPADAITVSANTGLSGDGTAGTPLAGIPASAAAAGYMSIADFNKLATVQGPVNTLVASYKTATFDFLAAPAAHNFTMPLVAGYGFVLMVSRLVFVTRNTADGTIAFNFNIAQNGASISFSNSSIPAATYNGLTPPFSLSVTNTGVRMVDLTTLPLQTLVTQAAGGGTLAACTGYQVIEGYYELL